MCGLPPAHNAETTSSRKSQYRLRKLVNRIHYERYVVSLGQLPETTPPRETGDTRREKETGGFAKARVINQPGPGVTAFLGARSVDSSRVIPASEFVSERQHFLGMEGFLTTRCPCCGATGANVWHARLCHRSGTLINSTSPWYTRSPERLNACRPATKWKAELPSTPIGTA